MKCPYCNVEMVQGYVQSRDGVAWTTKKHLFLNPSPLIDIDAVSISNTKSERRTIAYNCSRCQTVIIPYGKNF